MGTMHDIHFVSNRPMYLNYGSLGYAIASEISRMIIDGKNYDQNGNFRDWWSPSTHVNYNNEALCVVEQYDKLIKESAIEDVSIHLHK